MNAKQNDERDPNLGSLNDDVGHTFDQTNGLVDGLGGDSDDPETVSERLDKPQNDEPQNDDGA